MFNAQQIQIQFEHASQVTQVAYPVLHLNTSHRRVKGKNVASCVGVQCSEPSLVSPGAFDGSMHEWLRVLPVANLLSPDKQQR